MNNLYHEYYNNNHSISTMGEYDSRKQWGENNRKNKLKNAIRQKHHSRSSNKISPFKYGYPFKEIDDSEESYTLSYLHAKPSCFDLGSVNGIISFLQNIDEYTPVNYKKLVKLAYYIKNTPHPEHKLFCHDCYSYKCEMNDNINHNEKKKKVNRKFVRHFDTETKKTNKFYTDDWKLLTDKKKKSKQYCDICMCLKKKCVTINCGKSLCTKCESKMRFSKNGCWFCRTPDCLRQKIYFEVIGGYAPESLLSDPSFQSLFMRISEALN